MKIHFLMPEMPLFTSSEKVKSERVEGMNKFPECDECMNQSFDPFACETCEDACNFEPYEEEEDRVSDAEDMTIAEFKDFWRNAA